MNERDDRDIRGAFASSRRVERGFAPSFRSVRERAPAPRPERGHLRTALAGLAAAALLLAWFGIPNAPEPATPATVDRADMRVMTVEKMTAEAMAAEAMGAPLSIDNREMSRIDESSDVAPGTTTGFTDERSRGVARHDAFLPAKEATQPAEASPGGGSGTTPQPADRLVVKARAMAGAKVEQREDDDPAYRAELVAAGRSLVASRAAAGAVGLDGLVTTVERETRPQGDIVVRVETGTVPLAGATVTIGNRNLSMRPISDTTDRSGRVEFTKLPLAGDYFVEVAFPGFARARRDGLTAWSDRTTVVAFDLSDDPRARGALVASADAARESKSDEPVLVSLDSVTERVAVSAATRNAIVKKYRRSPGTAGGATALGGSTGFAPVAPELDRRHHAESYDSFEENRLRSVAANPLSTFSIDVDTASYSNVRRFLTRGSLPPVDAVRIEELVNYFDYDYPQPTGDVPFATDVDIIACPWNPANRLARIGIKAREISRSESPGSNLVFLIDVSGSMDAPDKLPLLRSAMSLLVEQLDGRDQVAIVVYAGASGLALPPTPGHRKADLLDALEAMDAGGSTNGGEGLELAYRIARENFVPGGTNRVLLATDGDFNVGVTGTGDLLREIGDGANDGVFLTVLGFGTGNLDDDRLEKLADRGNGSYAYIDGIAEARKVLVEQIGGTLMTLARDVKIQVEFNPLEVESYRLIGYENRMLASEDFNDDRKDAGELGAGLTVTALYELVPAGTGDAPAVDPLRYGDAAEPSEAATSGESFTLKMRYKKPEGGDSLRVELPVRDDGSTARAPRSETKFAAAVAAFGMILRGSPACGEADLDLVHALAEEGLGIDERGYRSEFLDLVELARKLR